MIMHDHDASCRVFQVYTVYSVFTLYTVYTLYTLACMAPPHRPVWLRRTGHCGSTTQACVAPPHGLCGSATQACGPASGRPLVSSRKGLWAGLWAASCEPPPGGSCEPPFPPGGHGSERQQIKFVLPRLLVSSDIGPNVVA